MHHLNKYILTVVIVVFSSYAVYGQKCDKKYSQYKIDYIYSKAGGKLDTTQLKTCLIFESGFNDSLEILFNKKIVRRDFFKSDWSTGYTGSTIYIDYSKIKGRQFVVISSLTEKSSIKVEIKKGFVLIEISKSKNGDWSVIYSNSPVVFE